MAQGTPQDFLLGLQKEAAKRTDGMTPPAYKKNSQHRDNQMSKMKVLAKSPCYMLVFLCDFWREFHSTTLSFKSIFTSRTSGQHGCKDYFPLLNIACVDIKYLGVVVGPCVTYCLGIRLGEQNGAGDSAMINKVGEDTMGEGRRTSQVRGVDTKAVSFL